MTSREVPGTGGRLLAREDGALLYDGAELRLRELRGGYLSARVPGLGERLAQRLVCEAWHGPPPSRRHQAAHGNGDRRDNRPENLRWATPAENAADRRLHGTQRRGAEAPLARLTWEQAEEARLSAEGGESCASIAARLRVHRSTAWRAATGRTYGPG